MNSKKHEVPEALLTALLANYQKPEDLIGENGALKQLTKLLVNKDRPRRGLFKKARRKKLLKSQETWSSTAAKLCAI